MPLLLLLLFLCAGSLPAQLAELSPAPEPADFGTADWLLDPTAYRAGLYRGERAGTIELNNGLVRRTFLLGENAATITFDQLHSGTALLRGVKPEAELRLNGVRYPVGGLTGQPNYAYLDPRWIDSLQRDSTAFQFVDFSWGEPVQPFPWKRVRHHRADLVWPPRGVHLQMNYRLPTEQPLRRDTAGQLLARPLRGADLTVSVHYELYDGLPVLVKWLTVQNRTAIPVRVDGFTTEILAAVEYHSPVENRGIALPTPNIHVETDYAFAGMTTQNSSRHTVHWEVDPDYHTQVNYLKTTPCLLRVAPELGPGYVLLPQDTFQSFRTFVLPFDSYDRERNGLAQRRMYRTVAPWTTENPLMMHARFSDWDRVKTAIDQCAAVGFEMVILTFGSGFDIENDSAHYLSRMREYATYAERKGVEIGGYSLLASRRVGGGHDVVMPPGQEPTFGNSPCLASRWGADYFHKLYRFYAQTGFTLLEHDGSYPGDVCAATHHPGHGGLADSRWQQYRILADFYQWCRARGIYLNVPDYYYLAGSNKCAMGYREVNWSLPRAQQVIHTRQNIFDGTWTKGTSMGWMFVPLTEYHGGGTAATIEPLAEHLDHYAAMLAGNLGAGVQACYRGPRLYDTPATQALVKGWVDWFKAHRTVLEGDLIHLRRADGRDLDYWLNVDPQGEEKGLLMVFNPRDTTVTRTLTVPLYYTGLTDRVRVEVAGQAPVDRLLDRQFQLTLEVTVPAKGHTWVSFR